MTAEELAESADVAWLNILWKMEMEAIQNEPSEDEDIEIKED